jgi:hypothetical protein
MAACFHVVSNSLFTDTDHLILPQLVTLTILERQPNQWETSLI